MRIREIVFNNVRSFRGERRISFVDPDTNQVRPGHRAGRFQWQRQNDGA